MNICSEAWQVNRRADRKLTMDKQSEPLDVLLIGGGIMSATLGTLIAKTMPNKSTALVERLDDLAGESSGSWNNAGTGHAGL